jgi:hypothetical protein
MAEQWELESAVQEGNDKTKAKFAVKATVHECVNRFIANIEKQFGDDTNHCTIIRDGAPDLHNWLRLHDDDYKVCVISLQEISDRIQGYSLNTMADLCIPLLQRLGMNNKVAARVMDHGEQMMTLNLNVRDNGITKVTRYLGVPLFIAMALAYQCYDNVELAVYADHLFIAAKGEAEDDLDEMAIKMNLDGIVQHNLIGYQIDGLIGVEYENGLSKEIVFAPNESVIYQTKQQIVQAAYEGDMATAKAKLAKLVYFAYITYDESVNALYGISTYINNCIEYDKYSGYSVSDLGKVIANSRGASESYALFITSQKYGECFADKRAYIEQLTQTLRKPVRKLILTLRRLNDDKSSVIRKDRLRYNNSIDRGWGTYSVDEDDPGWT